MMRLLSSAWFFILLWGEILNAQIVKNVNFNACQSIPCQSSQNLTIDCLEQPVDYSGIITSPSFPFKVTNDTRFGMYTLFINANCPFTIQLTLDRSNFLIGLPNNTLTVGVGEEVDTIKGVIIEPRLKGTGPEDQDNIFYFNSGSRSIWIQIDASYGFFWFDIAYSITTLEESSSFSSTFSTTTAASSVQQIPCDKNGSDEINWGTNYTQKMTKNCSDLLPPDYSNCSSTELEDNITEDIANNHNKGVTKIESLNSKADAALPILHIVFDVASGENAQPLSSATRSLLSKLQNANQNFDNKTMMSISTFSGTDFGEGNYLNVLTQPVNVVQNSFALINILQYDVPASETTDVTRDPGAAIRDSLSLSFPNATDILYLVSRRYVDGGPTVEELDMIDTLLSTNMVLFCVEGGDISYPNRLLNLQRAAGLTEGYYFTNTDNETSSWANTNSAAVNELIKLSKSPINYARRVFGRSEYFGVSNVTQTGSFLITSDLGNNSLITIQSSQKGIVTMALTNIPTGVTATLMTKGGTNWNMNNANLFFDALDPLPSENRGRWTYALNFEPANDALDTKSDVVILGLSSKTQQILLEYLPGVWTLNCNLDFPDQQNTVIYAEVIGPIGVLTGLSVTVTLANVDDTSSQDVSIVLTEEVQGMGFYSGIFNPPFDGLFDFFAMLKADNDSVCTGDLCAPNDFSTNAPGRCQIKVQGKYIDTTPYPTEPPETSEPTTDPIETLKTSEPTSDTTETSESTTYTSTVSPTSLSSMSTATSGSSGAASTPRPQAPCDKTDPYGVTWKTYTPETTELSKNCSEGVPYASGLSFWICNCDNKLVDCAFETSQPNYTLCQSEELVNITQSINNTDVEELWKEIEKFTESKHYYGQDIFQILTDAIEALLNRMQREIDEEENPDYNQFLEVQINSSMYATLSMDHLITNEAQWDQLINQGKGNEEILALLKVSNDIGFRLSNVSKLTEVPLLCEYSFPNVTISSYYWDGTQGSLFDCNLINISFKENFLRFPISATEKEESFIILPDKIKNKSYKTAGVLIAASNLIQLLLPGNNSKRINSPLISYTLYHPEANSLDEEALLPNDSHVQFVFKHEVNAKYPSVRTIRRDLNEGEENSAVIGSSVCSFLELNNANSNEIWTWDDEGCRVLSTNSTHTVCNCSHLTGFADHMDFHNFVGRSEELDITRMASSTLSIIALASTFCILLIFRAMKMNRTFLTQNLCITLMISHFMILLTLDRHFLELNDETCAAMGILLHYMLLASFMWMFLEGFLLYRIALNVLDAWTKTWTIFYFIVAYTIPLFIVGITVSISFFEPEEIIEVYNSTEHYARTGILQVYSGDETCWLVGDWMWAFSGPVVVIIAANFFFLIIGIGSSLKSIRKSKSHKNDLTRGMILRVLSLTCLLVLSWIFGFLLFFESIVFAFIFTISNGLQGVVIFIDRCILNKKIRNAITTNMNRFSTYMNSKWNTKKSRDSISELTPEAIEEPIEEL